MVRDEFCTPLLEPLEDRVLMSTTPVLPTPGVTVAAQVVAVTGGNQLRVVGTDKADSITVDKTSAGIVLTAGALKQTFTGAYVSLAIYGFGGDDTLRVANNVTLNTSIYGGAGNDTIFDAGKGADVVYGEAGNDLIVSIGGGKDTISGGDGADRYWVDSTDVISDATAAENAAGAVHRITSFYQPYTTNSANGNYVSTEIAGQKLADPTLTSTSYRYADYSARPLFVNGAQYNDIAQGALGDCYYLAALASIAQNHPDTIQQAIAPLGDGTFAVRFYNNGSPVYLRIDGDLPVNSGGSLVYARLTPQGETWVALMEKAYAYFRYAKNTYASIEGGWMGTVYSQITNLGYTNVSTAGSLTNLKNTLTSAVAASQPITLGSNSNASGPIVGGHAYMVQSVTTDANGNTWVTVYNPWGVDGRSYDSNPGDGLLKLSLADVQKYFGTVCISRQ